MDAASCETCRDCMDMPGDKLWCHHWLTTVKPDECCRKYFERPAVRDFGPPKKDVEKKDK